ncbi:MAG TPA: ester cyclase [Acidimicrobiales bacterium]|nr:ester cyclase [Acidimicrobiales bacterium]
MHHADDAVLVEARNTGTHLGPFRGVPDTGRWVDHRVACVFEFDGDQLVRVRIYYDVATILRQIGALALP